MLVRATSSGQFSFFINISSTSASTSRLTSRLRKVINAIAVRLPRPLSCARAHANLRTPQRNCPTSSWRRLCEQVFVLSQELRQRLRWLAGEVFERVGDVIEGLIFGRASAQVAPQVGEVFHRNSVDPDSRSVAGPLIVVDLDITHRPAQDVAE